MWPLAPDGKIVQQNYTNPTAPVYIINGAAGNVEGASQSFHALISLCALSG
jgi:hypothetical protein